MTDSTRSGHVGHKRAARSPELVVEPDTRRQAEEALGHLLAQARQGAGAVALQCEQVFAGEEDRLDALADPPATRMVWEIDQSRITTGPGRPPAGLLAPLSTPAG